MNTERRRRILAALVEEYIRSAQPVGSKVLVERYELGCSPATVRNELAILEETGYVFQPHVSAGRVPTDVGYREYVDAMSPTSRSLSRDDISAIHDRFVHGATEIGDLMRDTACLLSRLTSYVAVVLTPAASAARIRKVDLVSLAPRRALVVVITDTGQVLNRMIDLEAEATGDDLRVVESALNHALDGTLAEHVRLRREGLTLDAVRAALAARVMDEVVDCLMEADRARVRQAGTASLLEQPEFAGADSLRPLMALLEDGVALLETLSGVMRDSGVVVRIGHENPRDDLGNVSLVAANYGGGGESEGIVGVIGPTRMNYPRAIASVRAVSDGLTDALGEPARDEDRGRA
ncbi:MAG: heat-inducible transcription repressor HrcA [Actinobacteria bacterium]|nr:MAG: heat-inducible transcription repressor HrcA [Actinomycetota bacterium]